MAGIREEDVEWATVDRLRQLLQRPSRKYSVTDTYSLFTTILCWVLQRLRAPADGSPIGNASAAFWQELNNERVEDRPWLVWTTGEQPTSRSRGPYPQLENLSIADLLVALRRAVAHGDGRRIRPVNQNGRLIGHEFRVSIDRDGQAEVVPIQLNRTMMRRIGVALASRFCAALVNADAMQAVAEHGQAIEEAGGV